MLEATNECHRNAIIHRDIKLDNFLVKDFDCDHKKPIIKLADFGISCKYDPANPPSDKCGTSEYVAPEVLSQPHYDSKVDCYGLGIVLFELLSNFETADFLKQRKKLERISEETRLGTATKKHRHWKNVSIDAIDLILKLTETDPSTRLSAQDAMSHSWFK